MASDIQLGILGVIATVLGLLYYLEWATGKLRAVSQRLTDLVASFGEPPFDPVVYYSACNAFLSTKESVLDDTHYLDEVEQHIDLTNDAENVVMTEHYHGRNVSAEPSETFRFYWDSETFIEDDVTVIQHLDDGEEVELELLEAGSDDQFVGTYLAAFHDPLERNESFELEVVSEMGSWDLSVGQYVYFDFNRFERGVGQVKCSVGVDTPPRATSAYRAVNHADTSHHNDPAKLDFELTDDVELYANPGETEFWVQDRDLRHVIFIIMLEW